MDINEFTKTIKFEELGWTGGDIKFMHKSHLNVLLRGGKFTQPCRLYTTSRVSRELITISSFDVLNREKFHSIGKLQGLFMKMLEEGKWEEESSDWAYYDEHLCKIEDYDPFNPDSKQIIAKIVETRTKTTYFIDKNNIIKEAS